MREQIKEAIEQTKRALVGQLAEHTRWETSYGDHGNDATEIVEVIDRLIQLHIAAMLDNRVNGA